MPDPDKFDLSTTSELTASFLLTLAFGFTLLRVAISVASWLTVKSAPILLICKVPLPFVNVNLSDVKVSVVPSALIKLYLSSSNGKNVVLSPAVTAAVSASVDALIATSNTFLIARVASLKSTYYMRYFGNGV